MRLAGIDIGTLTCQLLIADIQSNNTIRNIYSSRKKLWLGEDVDQNKRLKPEAMARVIQVIQDWGDIIKKYEVRGLAAVATSAVRNASNSKDFLVRAKQETMIEIEVIDGEEEARRTLLGLRYGLPCSVHDILGIDIGGGSLEFIASPKDQPPKVFSIEIGVIRLSERILKSDPPTSIELETAKELIQALTEQALNTLGDVSNLTLVGTGGTITSLAAIAQGLTTYAPERIHNYSLTLEEVKKIEKTIVGQKKIERSGKPGLEVGREEVIVAGTLILRCIMEKLDFNCCTVSEYGLREGILVDLIQKITSQKEDLWHLKL